MENHCDAPLSRPCREDKVTDKPGVRDMEEVLDRHRRFWECAETDRPLVIVTYDYMLLPQVTASAQPLGEVTPEELEVGPTLEENDKVARVRDLIGDDGVAAGGVMVGMPWLEAMCGCRVLNADNNSLWREPLKDDPGTLDFSLSADNPWFRKLLEVERQVVEHAAGRYPVSICHKRGPADVLNALYGSDRFFLDCYDDPERIARQAQQVARMWVQVARAEREIIPRYLGGFAVLEYDLWAPEIVAYFQDDTSGMISLGQYRQLFVPAMRTMAFLPYNALHLHIPSLHVVEELATLPNIRAVNCNCDSSSLTIDDALPTLRRVQERGKPIIIDAYAEEGFSLDQYEHILEVLSPRGLSVHLKAGSVEEGREVMEYVRQRAQGRPS
jgi:hypothetical protein